MRKTLGFGVVLAAVYLTGTFEVAYSQTGAAGGAGQGARAPSAVGGVVNNVEQQAAQATGLNNNATPAPAVPGPTTPTIPGPTTAGVAAPGAVTTTPANTYQTPGMTGAALNPAGTTTAYPGTTTNYSANYAQPGSYPGTYTGATPGYTGRTMPGMVGYNSVNPMGTTMAPPYYYAGSAGMPYATYSNPGYASGYAYPAYTNTTYQTYPVRQRRGLFGFGRRNRVVYPASPYGYNTYSNGANSPYGYSTYGTTTYYSTPGSYSYGTYPY